MKIASWNVNGIRSVFRTTFRDWLTANDPDIVCLQEIKADYIELSKEYTELDGYYAYFNSSSLRKGHSGVAVYTKIKPLSVETKVGIERFDEEGRCLKLTFKDFTLFNFYIPNGARDKHDIPYKLEVYEQLLKVLEPMSKGATILTGDFNIAHTELDVYYAKENMNNTMFTPAERKQLDELTVLGYTDAFRYKHPETKAYTWWMYANGLRERDIGWRIDYFFVSQSLVPLVEDSFMQREILGSDHAPLWLLLNKEVPQSEPQTFATQKAQPGLF